MKKIVLSIVFAASAYSLNVNAQVGINVASPTSTLDITAKNATGTSKNVDGLLVPRVDRERAQNMASVPTSTLIFVNSIATGTQAGTAVNIDATGYYYYNGTAWIKLSTGATPSVNIYNTDGSLTGNRVVTQGANTLAFNGTATNAFSVDGSTLSVDAANDRLGVGTATPETKLHVVSATSSAGRYNLFDAPASVGEVPLVVLRNTSPVAANNTSYLGFSPSNGSGGASWGIGSQQNSATAIDNNFQIAYSNGGNFQKFFNILPSGNTGIGTTTPQKKLHINGDMQLTNELNVGGNATTAGSAGTTGQILTSAGPGVAPSWQTPVAPASVNIYNADGTLTGNRVVTQNANTLAFHGTATNAFSVDGTTLSVDAANDRVGIGTAAPENKFHVASTTSVSNRYSLVDAPNGTASTVIMALRNTSPMATGNFALLGFTNSGTTSGGANWGIGSVRTATNEDFYFGNSLGSNYLERMRITSAGLIGVGTSTPQKQLHVNGGLQITNELNVGGNATTAGSAGTAGQILKSNGAGVAPSWQSENSFVAPSDVGSVIAVGGQLAVAQEFTARMAADWAMPINIITKVPQITDEVIDNKNRFSGSATTNQFSVETTGSYMVTMNFSVQSTDGTSAGNFRYGVIDSSNSWVGYVLETIQGLNNGEVKNLNYVGILNLVAGTTYSFATIRNGGSTGTLTMRGTETLPGSPTVPITLFTLKRVK